MEPVASVPVRGNPHTDPVISGEINWSVSQLRSLFNQGLANDNRKQMSGTADPGNYDNMAYRASPARKQFLERRLNYPAMGVGDITGLAGSNYVNMYNPDNQTDSDQESYV